MYNYTALPAIDHIRLVRLKPGRQEDIVACELFATSLPTAPPYEAVSYVWGNPNQTVPVLVGGEKHHITTNLHAFLQQRRAQDAQLPFWIDALCINQSDKGEKMFQVRLMPRIYGHASQLSIWLGSAAHNTELGFFVLENLSENANWRISYDKDKLPAVEDILERDWWQRVWVIQELANFGTLIESQGNNFSGVTLRCGKYEMAWSDLVKAAENMCEEDLKYGHPRHLCFKILAFEKARKRLVRSLIQQPLILKSNSDLIESQSGTGPVSIEMRRHHETGSTPIKTLIDFTSRMSIEKEEKEDGDHDDEPHQWCTEFSDEEEDDNPDLLSIIKLYRNWKSTDPRDKIYGLLGLAANRGDEWTTIDADYDKRGNALFREIAKLAITTSGKLDILSHCQDRCPQAVASWVPDWTTPMGTVSLMSRDDADRLARIEDYAQKVDDPKSFIAGGSSSAKVSFSNNLQILSAEGFYVDKVSLLSDVFPRAYDWNEMVKICGVLGDFLDVITDRKDINHYSTTEGAKEAFWTSVFSGRVNVREELSLSVGKVNFLGWLPKIPRHWTPKFRKGHGSDQDFKYRALWAYGKYDLGVSPFSVPSSYDPFSQYRLPQYRSGLTPRVDSYFQGQRYLENRRLFITENGYIGLGPANTRCEDAVMVLFGADVPFIFSSKDEESFELAGECYVHGVMEGEIIKQWEAGEVQSRVFNIH